MRTLQIYFILTLIMLGSVSLHPTYKLLQITTNNPIAHQQPIRYIRFKIRC
jgi:hypothetical protein